MVAPAFANYPPPPPPRSAIPRVIGILGIVFACLGALFMAVWTFGPLSDIYKHHLGDELGGIVSWLYAAAALSVLVFALHLTGAIMAVIYKFTGLRLLTLYGALAIIIAIADIAVLFAMMPSHVEGRAGLTEDIKFSVVYMRVFFHGLGLAWPITVLALANSKGARAACT